MSMCDDFLMATWLPFPASSAIQTKLSVLTAALLQGVVLSACHLCLVTG